MQFKAAIFDLDGVVVDTVPLHFKAWRRMFSEYGKKFSFDEYKQKVDGIPRADGCRAILTDIPDEVIRTACDKKQSYYLEFLEKDGIEVYETTISLIEELKSRGIKIAVISSSKNCSTVLDKTNITNFFEIEVNGNDITKGKPDPQIFLTAAERLGLEPSGCIVFEDATLGVEAAKRANMLCVGVDRNNRPNLFKKADLVIKDLGEINFKILESLF